MTDRSALHEIARTYLLGAGLLEGTPDEPLWTPLIRDLDAADLDGICRWCELEHPTPIRPGRPMLFPR